MTLDQLKRILPGTTRAATFFDALVRAMAEFHIKTPQEQARFLAQVGHETGNLSVFEENLNYSAERLTKVWPSRFPTIASTAGYARNPVALANKVYANRMGNRDEKSGDGWMFRGSGCIQLTGRDNQYGCALYFDVPLDDIGDWLRTPEGAARSAGWYWMTRGLNNISDFDKLSDLVNIGRHTQKIGDANGYEDRLAIYNRALAELA